ncbi:AsmA-like C-terminal region-containing protein [Leeia sp.]|uniref:AsmA-like C-terminal region-containing protein n=1 Tax=Leeia sp. TaxID=2884678 RepID=UPI0035B054C4
MAANNPQFQTGLIFAKTLQGEEEVKSRQLQLERNVRLVLILVDGVTPVAQLLEKVPSTENVPSILARLWREGLIEPASMPSQAPDMSPGELGPASQSPFRNSQPLTQPPIVRNEPVWGDPVPDEPLTEMPPLRAEPPLRGGRSATPAKPPSPGKAGVLHQLTQWWSSRRSRGAPRTRVDRVKASRQAGVILLVGLVLTLGATAALPWLPIQWQPAIAQQVSDVLCGQGSHYAKVRAAMWPSPHWQVEDIAGDGCTAPIASLEIRFPWLALVHQDLPPDQLLLKGMTLDAGQLSSFLQRKGGDGRLPVIRLQEFTLKLAGQDWAGLNGEMTLEAAGVSHLRLAGEAMSFTLKREGAGYALEGAANGLKIAGVSLDDVSAKGVWLSDRLNLNELVVRAAGGSAQGRGSLSLGATLQWQADLAVQQLDLARWPRSPLLPEGEAKGNVRVTAQGQDWASLWKTPQLGGTLELKHGVLAGMDLLDVAQAEAAQLPGGGRTLFLQYQTRLDYRAGQWSLSSGQLQGPALNASLHLQGSGEQAITGSVSVSSSKLRLASSSWAIQGAPGQLGLRRTSGGGGISGKAPQSPSTPSTEESASSPG